MDGKRKSVEFGKDILRGREIDLAFALKEAMDSYPSNKTIGIGRYHSHTEWRAKAYGARVIAVYNNLK